MIARRPCLEELSITPTSQRQSCHVGLWLDKYLKEQYIVGENVAGSPKEKQAKSARSTHLKAAEKSPIPEGYKEAYERWEHGLKEAGCMTTTAEVEGRMIVGLGDKNPLEIGITLQHTWGAPYIPGSALKGLASATAARLIAGEDWQRTKPHPADAKTKGISKEADPTVGSKQGASVAEKTSADILFGYTERMGAIIFHDAWWIPRGASFPLHLDVMTVHHPEYYQQTRPEAPPSDTDSPNPVSFLSVNGIYRIALEGDPAWCNVAYDLLQIGLKELGVGAKTHSGYGRLKLGLLEDNSPLTPEKWAAKALPDTSQMAAEVQYKKLLDSQKSPPYPPTLQAEDCKRLLCERFAGGVEYAKQQSAAQGASVGGLKQQLADLQANPPPKEERKRWKDKIERLEKQIQQEERKAAKAGEQQKEAQSLLVWLGMET